MPLRRGLVGVVVGPLRRPERTVSLRPPQLNQNRIAHRLLVSLFRRVRLVELVARFAPHPVLRSGKPQNAVSGTVRKEFPLHAIAGVLHQVPRSHRADSTVLDLDGLHRGVEQHREVLLLTHEVVHHIVPHGIVQFRIEIEVVQLELLQQTGLLPVRPVRTADPHPDLARRIAAEHRPILNDQRLRPVPRRGHRGTQPGHPASDDHKIRFHSLFAHHHSIPSPVSSPLVIFSSQYPFSHAFSSQFFESSAVFYFIFTMQNKNS